MKRIRQLLALLLIGATALALCLPATAEDKTDSEKWVSLFNGKDLTGWKTHPKSPGDWKVEDGILVGRGPVSHLFSEKGDYENVRFKVVASINDKGNSGQYIHAEFAPGFPPGFEAQINSTHGDPIRTGSLYPDGRDKYSADEKKKMVVLEKLVPPDTWFTQEVIAVGNHIIIKVNDKVTVDFVDEKNRHPKGHFALQQHNLGSEVKFKSIEVIELPPTK